jgi:SAM-dependent methyltransferase
MNQPDPSHREAETRQRDYYNRIAAGYDTHHFEPWALRCRTNAFDLLFRDENLNGLSVLDAACGGGENSVYFAARGAELTGIDVSDRQCELYASRFPDHRVARASITGTELPDDAFDLVLTNSLHHLHPHVNEAVAELTRVLKPGGRLVLWEPNSGSFLDLLRKLWYRLDRNYFEPGESSIDFDRLARTHVHALTERQRFYGGNVGHLFVMEAMIFRIPHRVMRVYAPVCLWMEGVLRPILGSWFSCWGLALYEKRGTTP